MHCLCYSSVVHANAVIPLQNVHQDSRAQVSAGTIPSSEPSAIFTVSPPGPLNSTRPRADADGQSRPAVGTWAAVDVSWRWMELLCPAPYGDLALSCPLHFARVFHVTWDQDCFTQDALDSAVPVHVNERRVFRRQSSPTGG